MPIIILPMMSNSTIKWYEESLENDQVLIFIKLERYNIIIQTK